MEMERARKEKALVPVEVGALAVRGKGKGAVKEAAGAKEKAKVAAKAKGAARGKHKTADKISELVPTKGGALQCQVETERAPWERDR